MPTADRGRLPPMSAAFLLLGGLAILPLYLQGESLVAALVIALGIAVLPSLIHSPVAALVLLVTVEFSQASSVIGSIGGISLYAIAHGIAIAAIVSGIRRKTVEIRWSPVYLFAGFFIAARALSITQATDTALATSTVRGEAQDLLTLVLVVTLLASTARFGLVARTIVVVIGTLAALSVLQEYAFAGSFDFGGFANVLDGGDVGLTTARHAGPLSDANFWGRLLIVAAPFALSLGVIRRGTAAAWGWGSAALLVATGVYLTQSRGALLALVVTLVMWLLVVGRPYTRFVAIIPLALIVLVSVPATGSRVATLSDLSKAGGEGGDLALVGRVAAQESGFAMFRTDPLLGVGPGNFEIETVDVQRDLGFVRVRPLAPHNVYLQMASESGVVGLGAWILLIGSGLVVGFRATVTYAARAGGRVRSTRALLGVAAVTALIGWSTVSAFLHLNQFRALLVIIGFAAALDIVARSTEATPGLVASQPSSPPSR